MTSTRPRKPRTSLARCILAQSITGLGLCALAVVAVSAPVERPILMDLWRTIFARPQNIPAPPGNPMTPAKIDLGRRLFHDVRLSGGEDRSCATCHRADRGYSNGRRLGHSRNGRDLTRNVPALHNLAWATRFFWDGRATSLEEQAAGPILNPNEMGGNWPQITARLRADPAMAAWFTAAFPEADTTSHPITPERIVQALAAYERTLISPPTRLDRFLSGDADALTAIEQEGFALFVGRAGCIACHGGWRFTDDRLHDIGLPGPDSGAGDLPGGPPGLKAFKTPSLRELRHTAPYMHDGSKATLDEVLTHYNGGFSERPEVSPNIVRDLNLTLAERRALIAFLNTLSSE